LLLRCAVLGIHHVVSFIVCMYHLLKTVCIIRDRGKPLLWMENPQKGAGATRTAMSHYVILCHDFREMESQVTTTHVCGTAFSDRIGISA
jgi:hypothetical protein